MSTDVLEPIASRTASVRQRQTQPESAVDTGHRQTRCHLLPFNRALTPSAGRNSRSPTSERPEVIGSPDGGGNDCDLHYQSAHNEETGVEGRPDGHGQHPARGGVGN